MTKVKGILVQRKGPMGVLMTSEGRFIRVMLTGKNNILGQEILGHELKYPSLIQSIIAASVLVVLLMGVWSQFFINPAAAYVALDINPSLELTVNGNGTVIEVKGLNEDGKELLEKVAPKKMEIYQAVESLVEEAAKCNYLNNYNNVILATVIPTQENLEVVEQDKLETTVQLSVAQLQTPVKIVTEIATEQEHSAATKNGVSVGRYLIHQGSAQKGGNISLDELKTKGLGELEKEKEIEIQQYLPHPKMKGKVEIEVKQEPTEKLQYKETLAPTMKNQPNKILPPGQQKKQDTDRSSANWKEIPDHPSQKEAKPTDDERDGAVKAEEKESQKRRDDRRQSYMQHEEITNKEKPSKTNQQQNNGKQRDDKEKDRQKGNDKAKEGKDY